MPDHREARNRENRLAATMQGMGLLAGALQVTTYQLANLVLIGALWVIWGAFNAVSFTSTVNPPRTAVPLLSLFSLGSAPILPLLWPTGWGGGVRKAHRRAVERESGSDH